MQQQVFASLQGKIFFSFWKCPGILWGSTSLQLNGYHGSLPLVNRPGRDADHSPPSSAEVRNDWSYTSTLRICLNYVDRNNLTVTLRMQLHNKDLCPKYWKLNWFSSLGKLSEPLLIIRSVVDCVWNVMAHPQKPDFVFRAKRIESI